MLLANYLTMRIYKYMNMYLLWSVFLFSAVELIEKVFRIPMHLNTSMYLTLWLLSVPSYITLLLPACYFISLVVNHVYWASTQQTLMFLVLGWSDRSKWFAILKQCVVVVLLLFFAQDFLAPWSRQFEQTLLQEVFSRSWTWRLRPGFFTEIAVGDESMLAYTFKQDNEPKVFVVPTSVSDKLQWSLVEGLYVEGGVQPALVFSQGQTGVMDQKHLQTLLSYSSMQLPVQVRSGLFTVNDVSLHDSKALLKTSQPQDIACVWWRVNTLLFTVGLCCIACKMLTIDACRYHVKRTMTILGFLYITYFLALMWARSLFDVNPSILWYAIAHGYAICMVYVGRWITNKESFS